MPAADSSPRINWALVRLTPHGELWELVAWSCGIYPDLDTYVGARKAKLINTWERAAGADAEAVYRPPRDEFHERVHTATRYVGEFRALRPVGSIPTDDLGYCTVRVADVAALALKLGWDVPPEFAALAEVEPNHDSVKNGATSRPESVSAQQAKQILEVVIKLGYDPAALPKPAAGKAGIKKRVRALLPRLSAAQFDHRWKELRKEGAIADAFPIKRKR